MTTCFISNEVNRMLSEQEAHDAAYQKALTEVEMDFLATYEAIEVLTQYVLDSAVGTGVLAGFFETAYKLVKYDIDPEDVPSYMLLSFVLFRSPAAPIALQELCNRIITAAHEHGYIERMVQERM